ncbi:hypothetical protein [Mesorhizobium sp.]|uniref:hypothetical protein n=1 Tax=Mesorhizobium sp. TaxID=1871066 RepID=UPI0034190E58
MKQSIEYGEVRRERIGAAIQNLPPDLAYTLGTAARAYVPSGFSREPAERAE